jgi:hypothetical protein
VSIFKRRCSGIQGEKTIITQETQRRGIQVNETVITQETQQESEEGGESPE